MTVMVTIIVASSASPIGPNGTLEMYKRNKKEVMMTTMMMMKDDDHDDKHDDCDDNYHRSILCISNWA